MSRYIRDPLTDLLIDANFKCPNVCLCKRLVKGVNQ